MPSDPPSAPTEKRRIGLFGGTFDPPHIGHLLTGQSVAEARNYDEVWFVVANDPWQKRERRAVSPARLRIALVEAACYWSRHSRFVLKPCDIEVRTGGPSYTADTLRTLGALFPDIEFEVIVGSDAAAHLHTWHDAGWLAENAHFVLVRRDGQNPVPAPGFQISTVESPLFEVSSTEIRNRVSAGAPVDNMVPSSVDALLRAHGLYREPDQ
jgi:nicotinate-nucleotide adenylyltransferase